MKICFALVYHMHRLNRYKCKHFNTFAKFFNLSIDSLLTANVERDYFNIEKDER